jgi:cytochrome c-type biogenesis protein CcmH/NrfG
MTKFCPSCGTKLEQEYNFCPSCGFDLRKVTEPPEGVPGDTQSEEIILCDNCGEENSPGNKLCEYCGAPLKGTSVKKDIKENKAVKAKTSEPKKQQAKLKSAPVKNPPAKKTKELEPKKMLMIIGGVIIVIFIILWASGVLNSSVPEGVTQNQVSGQSSGVDLNNIQKINELETQVKNNPDDADLLLELAHLKNDSGLYEQAIVDYQKYLEKNPSNPDARIDMGVCYYNLHNYDEAIKQMEKALQYSPQHQIGYLNLGIVNLTAGNFEKSQDWLKKAVQIDPNSEIGKKAQELLESHKK